MVDPNCGQLRAAGNKQITTPAVVVVETSIQTRSTVALALAAPAKPARATTLPIATAKKFRIALSLRLLRVF
jgi:hypothetical protein